MLPTSTSWQWWFRRLDLTLAAVICAALAAGVHLYIWWLETVAWMRPETRAVFGIASEDDARITRSLAFNQGYYNLFLAVVALVGVALVLADAPAAGWALLFAGCGSMTAAAVVLVSAGGRRYLRAALAQGTLPTLAVAAGIVALSA